MHDLSRGQRALLCLLAFSLVLALPSPAQAQDQAKELVVLTADQSGASLTTAGDHSIPFPVMTASNIDLAALAVSETPDAFRFHVMLRQPATPGPAPPPGYLTADFTHSGATYHIEFTAPADTGGQAALYSVDAVTGDTRLISPIPKEVSADQLNVYATVPRDLILDTDGSPPFAGRQLEGFWAAAYGLEAQAGNFGGAYFSDRMPADDHAKGTTPFPVQYGVQSSGTVRLFSPDPSRASNGEATTYLFSAFAVNGGTKTTTYSLTVSDVPTGWTASIQRPVIVLAPGEKRQFPVLVTTPFAHIHGDVKRVNLKIQDENDAQSFAHLGLTVNFFAIPQPAGHHNTLFIHSRPGPFNSPVSAVTAGELATMVTMNALADDPADTHQPADAKLNGTIELGSDYYWAIPLDPSLRLGLDFDPAQTGKLSFPLQAQVPFAGTLGAKLEVQLSNATVSVGNFTSLPVNLQPNQGTVEELTFTPNPAHSFIPTPRRASLVLTVTLSQPAHAYVSLTPTDPQLLSGGLLTLPLREYHDPIDPSLLSAPDLRFTLQDPVEQRVRPGQVLLYHLAGTSTASAAADYGLTVFGTHAEWAHVVGGAMQAFPSRQTKPVVVAVTPPPDAPDGTVMDLVLQADPPGDGAPALVRMVATVDSASSHPDQVAEYARLLGAHGAAGVPLPAMVLTLAGLGLLGRRRRVP